MGYFEHLKANWAVAGRSLIDMFHDIWDVFAHFTHGLLPFIKIRHQQPENNK
jgi:hypothetical protein